jgi:hypothetical protein
MVSIATKSNKVILKPLDLASPVAAIENYLKVKEKKKKKQIKPES